MQDGDTALIKAIVLGNSVMAKLLIECGANKDYQNKVNRTGVSGLQFDVVTFGRAVKLSHDFSFWVKYTVRIVPFFVGLL